MKKYVLLSLLLAFSSSMFSQTKLSLEQQKQIIDRIDKAASGMKSMQCDFVQTKSMKLLKRDMQSKGVMYFKQPNLLRWQYTSPYDYIFILNNNKVGISSVKSSKTIDVQKNKMFRQITNIILKSITGGGLKSSTDFQIEIYNSSTGYFAKMYPKKKEVKQIYDVIEIYFNQELTMVSGVKMYEKTGDVTMVSLDNVRYNLSINEELFKIN